MKRFTALLRHRFVQDTLALQISSVLVIGLSALSSIVVLRALGVDSYGTLSLAQALFATLQAFNVLAPGAAAQVTLSQAHAAGDSEKILDVMAHSLKLGLLWSAFCATLLMLAGVPLANWLYQGTQDIGVLASTISLAQFADTLYNLLLMTLISRRAMRLLAVVQTVNQGVLSLCLLGAALIAPSAAAQVAAQLVYAYVTAGLLLLLYLRERSRQPALYPTPAALAARVWTIPLRRYAGLNLLSTVDKKLAGLMSEIPLQLTGWLLGVAAAGVLKAAQTVIGMLLLFTGSVNSSLQAVIPQAVQRGDFQWLWRNYLRVLFVLCAILLAVFIPLAMLSPVIVPLVFDADWELLTPLISVLCVYAVVSAAGATTGAIYRTLELYLPMIMVKLVLIPVTLPVGILMMTRWGVLGSAWYTNLLFTAWAVVTLSLTLRAVRQRAVNENRVKHGALG